jgi:hypothetical protein
MTRMDFFFLVDGLTGLYTMILIKKTVLNVAFSGSSIDMISTSSESCLMLQAARCVALL